ncbi:TetR/AcrR family transcriptional regulator [Mycobacterium sp. OAE908]|uniref:TetR/AcrR family transcriptional regulator n=1 Tax=Mycobacterium sp. OAE908 TaxID=2817899 RepID=UPI001AE283EA
MSSRSERTTTASASVGVGRRQRSDAHRNVLAIVEAAKTTFATRGVDVPAKTITDLAGVGIGTLYRHFPRRSDLILAVVEHEIGDCIEAAHELTARLEPREALKAWVDRFADFVRTKHGLANALHSGDPAYAGLAQTLLDRLEPVLDSLLERAPLSARSRDTVSARDVLTTIALICQPVPGETSSFNERMTEIFLEGLLDS